ncbi:MAG: NAD-binding protein [Deltaproteobacteria bacterium]|nr:NAD-binding protein [Deltaproteobacteria bacterium]
MKFLMPQLSYLLTQQEVRRNMRSLLQFLGFLFGTVVVYSTLFHVLMEREGQEHTWLTGFYWTLTVMSTLGFGDITFHSDLGRVFSILVLLSGIVLLLIVLPFTFIRSFYAPWLEAQLRLRAPRKIAGSMRDHIVICQYDEIAAALINSLDEQGIPHCVIESDASRAAALHADGVSAVLGEIDASSTYQAVRAEHARLVVANLDDALNTNITLTVREACGQVPLAALVEDMDSVDVLELAGASHVLPLKHRLGEHLATRVMVGTAQAHRVGQLKDLVIAEFPVHNTPLAGRTVADTRLRQLTGLNLVATAERGQLKPARADTVLTDYSVVVVVGTDSQISDLDALFVIYEPNENPVIVIGGGKVGRAVIRALKRRDVTVHVVEENPALADMLTGLADQVIIGDAANFDIVNRAGIEQAPSVVLTTNDDAMNIFLAVYCRRLNPDTRIVSRITRERNLEAIYRAGADFVLSYATLAVSSLLSLAHGRDLVLVGEGVDLFVVPVPASLAGKQIRDTGISTRTGLNVVAIQKHDGPATNPSADTELDAGLELVMLGHVEQLAEFRKIYG